MIDIVILKKRIGILLLLFSLSQISAAQTVNSSESGGSVEVTGTSSLHDWEMVLSSFSASAELNQMDDGTYTIQNAIFTANANNLSSDNSRMDKKAHEALEADNHPQISFRQNGNVSISGNPRAKINISGDLNIAGKTRPVSFSLIADVNGKNELTVSGEKTLKMSLFDIEPPTAMFGAIKAGDEITTTINLKLE